MVLKIGLFRWIPALVLLLALAGCSGDQARESGRKLSIISPHTTDIRDNLVPMFKQWYKQRTGQSIEVEWINQGGTSDDLRFIRSEFARTPNGIGIDLFWGGGLSPYLTLKKENLLQKSDINPALLRTIPPTLGGIPLYDPDHTWFGSCLSSFGILTNRMVMDYSKLPPVTTWEDLIQPVYFGWIGAADPRHSGSNHVAFDIILQGYGWEKGWRTLTLLSANMKRFNISSKDVIKDLVSGDVACSLAVDYYAWQEMEELGADKLGFVLPPRISMVNPDCFGTLKGAPHAEDARLFMEFVLSDACQKAWMLKAGTPGGPPVSTLSRLAIQPGVYPEVKGQTFITINPFKMDNFIDYDVEMSEKLWDVTNDLMGCLLVDSHDTLVASWKSIIDHHGGQAAIDRLCAMPITQDEALELAGKWDNEKVRNETINNWLRFARDKYAAAAAMAAK